MNGWTGAALGLWLVLALASVLLWWPGLTRLRWPQTRGARIVVVVVLGVGTGVVALLGAQGGPLTPPWSWSAVGVAFVAALLTGGALTSYLLKLADGPASVRVQPTVLRGGAWIGALERLSLVGTLLAGWPEGLAAIVALKAFARYPELKTAQGTGAVERFIIGTFCSLGWAAVCAGVVRVLL